MTFEFVFVPDHYVVFVILALFFFIVFFVFYLPIAISSSLTHLFTYLRSPFSLRRYTRRSRHPPRRRGPPPL
jgi:hypothetical protein